VSVAARAAAFVLSPLPQRKGAAARRPVPARAVRLRQRRGGRRLPSVPGGPGNLARPSVAVAAVGRRQAARVFVDLHNGTWNPRPISRWASREGFVASEHLKRYNDLGHGHRPGQDRQCRRPRIARRADRSRTYRRDPPPTHVPPAPMCRSRSVLLAGRAARGQLARSRVRVTPMHQLAPGRLAGCVRGWSGNGSAPRYYPKPGEGHEWRRCGANASPRAPTASRCSTPRPLGKIEVSGTRCRAISRPYLHQPLAEPGGRALPLRRDVPRRRHGVSTMASAPRLRRPTVFFS